MLQRLIHRLLKRRHFWRHASFSEIAELYASRTMRIFALRLISVFTSVFLYQSGYSLTFIALFWTAFYLLKIPFSWPSAIIAARLGPKHGTLISNVVSAAAMVALPFATNPDYGIIALSIWCGLQAFSGSMNDLCYMIDFSKVKNITHAGKEIGFMNIFEKIATGLSPLIGGFIALMFGPESVMILSAVFFLLSAVPLLLTAEQTLTKQRLNFTGFPWRATWRSLVAQASVGVDVFSTGIAWSLFLIVVVFNSGTDQVYAEIGTVASVTIFVALIAAYVFGRVIDGRRGGELLRASALANSGVHLLRPLVSTPVGVVLLNIINEATTTGYAMPFMRGLFDTADLTGKRVEYLFLIEMVVNLGAAFGALLLGLLFSLFAGAISLHIFFICAAVLTLPIMAPRFALYKK